VSKLKIYLSGPVSLGDALPPVEVQANRDRFRRVRERLTAEGFEVLDPTAQGVAACRSWQDWMRIGLSLLLRADRVLMLPGWRDSRGACVEYRLAFDLGIPVRFEVASLACIERQLAEVGAGERGRPLSEVAEGTEVGR
jgi:hypothetical protein